MQLEIRTGAGLLKTRRPRYMRLTGSTLTCAKGCEAASLACSETSRNSVASSNARLSESTLGCVPSADCPLDDVSDANFMKEGIWKISIRNAVVAIGARPNEVVLSIANRPVSLFAADDHDLHNWLFALRKASLMSSRIEDYYRIGCTIGEGMNGQVRQAHDFVTGEKVAVKVVPRLGRDHEDEFLAREVQIVLSLHHDNIVRTLDVFVRKRRVYFVMEFVPGGELFDYISEHSNFSERQAAFVIRDLLRALAYLHDKGIAHRDVKLENLLCAGTEWPFSIKLADFGFSNFLPPTNASATHGKRDESLTSFVGTPYYIAPEMLSASGHGRPVDLWATGVTMYILLSGKFPFGGTSEKEYYARVLHKPAYFPAPEWSGVSQLAKSLIRGFLTKDPKTRLTAHQALKHEWFAEVLGVTEQPPDCFKTRHKASVERARFNFTAGTRRQQGVNNTHPLLTRGKNSRPQSHRPCNPLSNSAAADTLNAHVSSTASDGHAREITKQAGILEMEEHCWKVGEFPNLTPVTLSCQSSQNHVNGNKPHSEDQSLSFAASRQHATIGQNLATCDDESKSVSKRFSLSVDKLASQLSSCSSPEVGARPAVTTSSTVLKISTPRMLFRALGSKTKSSKPHSGDARSHAESAANHPANSSSSSPDLSYRRYSGATLSLEAHKVSPLASIDIVSQPSLDGPHVADRPERQPISDVAGSYRNCATASPRRKPLSASRSVSASSQSVDGSMDKTEAGDHASAHYESIEHSDIHHTLQHGTQASSHHSLLSRTTSKPCIASENATCPSSGSDTSNSKSTRKVRRRPSASMVKQILSNGRLSLDSRISHSSRTSERYERTINQNSANGLCRPHRQCDCDVCVPRVTDASNLSLSKGTQPCNQPDAELLAGNVREPELDDKMDGVGKLSRIHFRSFHRPGSIDCEKRTRETAFISDPDKVPPRLARAKNFPIEQEYRPTKRRSKWLLFAKLKRNSKTKLADASRSTDNVADTYPEGGCPQCETDGEVPAASSALSSAHDNAFDPARYVRRNGVSDNVCCNDFSVSDSEQAKSSMMRQVFVGVPGMDAIPPDRSHTCIPPSAPNMTYPSDVGLSSELSDRICYRGKSLLDRPNPVYNGRSFVAGRISPCGPPAVRSLMRVRPEPQT